MGQIFSWEHGGSGDDCKVGSKNIWGRDIWQKIALVDTSIFIICVLARHKDNFEVTKFNNQVDKLTKKTKEAKIP